MNFTHGRDTRRALLILCFAVLCCVLISDLYVGRMQTRQQPIVAPASVAHPPTRLRIPRLGIDARVLPVGLLPNGAMDTPAKAADAGWFALGTLPGQSGSAVIAGHLDAVDGTPGIFWNLHTLRTGDDVSEQNDDGTVNTFRVINVRAYPADRFPLQAVFGAGSGRYLNLITCTGTWTASNGYAKRLVVTTKWKTAMPASL